MWKNLSLIFICILVVSGCTIEKRKYSSGYHTTWNVQHLLPKGNSANQSQREESKLSFSPKLHSNNEYALFPIFSDSTKNQKSENQTVLSVTTKKKNQRLAPIISDTVPEVKKKEQELPSTIQLKEQLQKDRRRVGFSWLSLVLSFITFIVGVVIYAETFSGLGGVLAALGFIGFIISLILIIAFTILKNKHKNQIKLNQKRHDLAINPSDLENHKSKKEIDARRTEINQILKKIKTVRLISGIISILSLTPLFPIGIVSLVVFLFATWKRNRLKEERYLLPYQEGETLPKPAISEEEKNILQMRLNKIMKRTRNNRIFLAISAFLILSLSLAYDAAFYAVADALVFSIFLFLILLLVHVILGIKKTKTKDLLNTAS